MTQASIPVRGVPGWVDHASGGPVVADALARRILLVYHGEQHHQGDPTRFYSFLGMARSVDGGHSFHDLGPIVTPRLTRERWSSEDFSAEVGPGSLVRVGAHVHVYSSDIGARGHVQLAVARAPLVAIRAALRHGRPVAFQKFHDGAFAEPGVGGHAAELLVPAPPHRVEWFDVSRHGRGLVLVFSCRSGGRWSLWSSRSIDGLRWSAPRPVRGVEPQGEQLYLTVVSRGRGLEVTVVRSRVGGFDRWRDAWVERLLLVPD